MDLSRRFVEPGRHKSSSCNLIPGLLINTMFAVMVSCLHGTCGCISRIDTGRFENGDLTVHITTTISWTAGLVSGSVQCECSCEGVRVVITLNRNRRITDKSGLFSMLQGQNLILSNLTLSHSIIRIQSRCIGQMAILLHE